METFLENFWTSEKEAKELPSKMENPICIVHLNNENSNNEINFKSTIHMNKIPYLH